MKKRTLIQLNSASTGGLGRLSRDISDVAINAGWKSYIAFGRGRFYDADRDFKFSRRLEIFTHAFLTRLTDKTGCYSICGTKKLLKFLDEKQPDILQIHNLHGYYINYPMLFDYIKRRHLSVVWTFHDCWPFTGHCVYFTMAKCTQWKYGCNQCLQTKKYPAYIWPKKNVSFNFKLKKECFCGVDNLRIITPSKWLSVLVKQSFLSDYPVDVIHNGIDLDVFKIRTNVGKRSQYKIPEGKKIVLGVASSWSERKGLTDFIRMSDLLPDEYVIVLAGLNKAQIKQLPNNMIGIEHTETVEDLVSLYNEAWVFVNPTYEDNFPTTNLESMACGTSVITYRTGGSPEAIVDYQIGKIIDTGNVGDLVEAVKMHEKNSINVKSCIERAQLFDKKKAYTRYMKLYNDILTN